jgi:cellulose synthase/poly-beta-1,6-N-acetylglucosamine synthase-like glycosyltransferase
MENSPSVSLIISVYDNISYLEMVLISVSRQTFHDFEVIIAEDNNGAEMKKFVQKQQQKFSFPIRHVFQEKKGFRKNRILNEAIKISNGKYLQFIDGDSVLHKNYLNEFHRYAKPGYILFGRRVELDETATNKFIREKKFSLLNPLKLVFTKSLHLKHGIYMPWVLWFQRAKTGMWGCSMGLMKEDLLKVNGFDEDYERIGVGEDIDLEWRLFAAGIKSKSMKHRALQYHLYHHRKNRETDIIFNFDLLNKKKIRGIFFCDNGLSKRI